MTHSTSQHRGPGTLLLKVARLLFDESVITAVVLPTISDLQREIDAAGGDRRQRFMARWRGYLAVWTLVVIGPFAFHTWPARPHDVLSAPPSRSSLGGWLLLGGVFALGARTMGSWTIVTAIGGLLVAFAIHYWHAGHPNAFRYDDHAKQRRPEINLSSIPVGGDAGGLMFMVGSVAVLVAGLPMWRWFFGAAVLGGVLTAIAVFVWHTSHPSHGLPQNRIVLR